jgi:CBS domain containing-hemolysin-like protein
MSPWILLGTAVALLFSFFFPGIEHAFLAANKPQIVVLGKQGSLSAKIMSRFIRNTTWLIATTRIGYIISLFFFCLFISRFLTPALVKYLPEAINNTTFIIFLIIIVCALLVLFTVELLVKSLFMIKPNQVVLVMAIPFGFFFVIFFPLVAIAVLLIKMVSVRLLKQPVLKDDMALRSTDLNVYFRNMHGVKYEVQDLELDKRIFQNALEFKTVRIRECMIPRTEIIAVSIADGIQKLTQAFIESGHSKILVYRNSIDEIIGYCHSSALFKRPETVESIITPIITVPETTLANDLMIQFINEHKSLALVMDEFGGISGIVSMEDIIEEIFGEIEDEHDEDDFIEQKLDADTYLLSARLEIDYLNDTYGWNLPSGDYDTLGGLILANTEDFPKKGETLPIGRFTFTIQATDDNLIITVKMHIAAGSDKD